MHGAMKRGSSCSTSSSNGTSMGPFFRLQRAPTSTHPAYFARRAISSPAAVSRLNARFIAMPSSTSIVRENQAFAATALRQFHASSPAQAKLIPFILTDVGEGIAECEVQKWYVNPGDKVDEFDRVCDLRSDKAAVEVTSRYKGKVTKVHYNVGDMAQVGKPLIDIELDADSADASTSTPSSTDTKPEAKQQQEAQKPQAHNESEEDKDRIVLTTPAVRRIARENNVNLQHVRGSGKGGRVMKEDVLDFVDNKPHAQYASQQQTQTSPSASTSSASVPTIQPSDFVLPSAASAAQSAPVFFGSQPLADKEVPIRGLQRIMAKTMTAANAVPHFGYCDEVVMDALHDLRNSLKGEAEKRKIKLTFMPLMLKAVSLALKQYPVLNSSVNADCTTLIYKGSHNLGFAMDTPFGLVVPNIKNVQHKSVFEVASEMARLAILGKEGKLAKDDLTGGTFTLSNVGSIGGTYAKPIIYLPEVAIGAVGKIQTLPRFEGTDYTKVTPQKIMCVSWSADHRVIDGATMANFSNLWKAYLEDPRTMFVDMV